MIVMCIPPTSENLSLQTETLLVMATIYCKVKHYLWSSSCHKTKLKQTALYCADEIGAVVVR